MADAPKGFWEKLEILLDPFGKILTGIMVVIIGYYTNAALQKDQQRRAYVELLSKREEADGNLRKDMFSKVIDQFVKAGERTLDDDILNLELLAYNFHESIDLGPLLKRVYARSWETGTSDQRRRLRLLAEEIVDRELTSLAEAGCQAEGTVAFDALVRDQLQVRVLHLVCAGTKGLPARRFSADVMVRPDHVTNLRHATELDVILHVDRLETRAPRTVSLGMGEALAQPVGATQERAFNFAVSPFDFPLIDNVRVGADGGRLSVVMTRVDDGGVNLAMVYFPDSRTSLRDKPFQDEVMRALD